jgi:type II secretory pathway pseudopilin PulG
MLRLARILSPVEGFTKLELLFVMMLTGILAAMALPSMGTMLDNYQTVFAAQEICTQLHYAKLKAIQSNESLRVSFPTETNTYQVELTDGTLFRGPFYFPRGISPNSRDGGNAVTFPGNYVLFQPDGSVPTTGNGSIGRIKLISRSGLRIDVLVSRGGIIRQTSAYKSPPAPF